MMNLNRVPLAEKMRPKSFDDFVGQGHIVGKNTLLYRAIKYGTLGSCIFYGPPGTGKTTLANIIANTLKANYVKINAVQVALVMPRILYSEQDKIRLCMGLTLS